jgi:hypothetical protein
MSTEMSKRSATVSNAVIAFFLVVAVGGWLCYSATNGGKNTWGWLLVAGLGLIATVVAGAMAGPE